MLYGVHVPGIAVAGMYSAGNIRSTSFFVLRTWYFIFCNRCCLLVRYSCYLPATMRWYEDTSRLISAGGDRPSKHVN